MPRAGIYRDRVRIEQFTKAVDAAGGAARTWATVREVSCQIMEVLPGREIFGAGTEVSEGSIRVRMRETPGLDLDPAMRLIDADRNTVYEIVQILPTRLREELTIIAKHGGTKR